MRYPAFVLSAALALTPLASWSQQYTDQEKANLQTVLAFHEKGLNQKSADEA